MKFRETSASGGEVCHHLALLGGSRDHWVN
jgi:hypothetical protein